MTKDYAGNKIKSGIIAANINPNHQWYASKKITQRRVRIIHPNRILDDLLESPASLDDTLSAFPCKSV